MKQKLTKRGGTVLLCVLVIGLLAVFTGGGLVIASGANAIRTLPAKVMPGQTFNVTVTFTAPGDNFNGIGLTDVAPAGWSVGFNKSWCDPDADFGVNLTLEEVDYLWFGAGAIYGNGTGFTAVYKVTVPGNATLGNYTFPNGTLEYHVGAVDYKESVGNSQVEVTLPKIAGQTNVVNCTSLAGVNVTAYQGAVVKASTLSDGSGNYILTLPAAFGNYNVTASKAGFRNVTQPVSVPGLTTYTLDFVGDNGLIPNAVPNISYVLDCINKWVMGSCGLTISGVLAVINAWVVPIS
jgi:hypothetical protein